ncbi:MAG TPA: metalloregulator ArsR/SmtB family transcription factor [Chloroflexota bacterium]|nr:metalloregulator ArsR/SmtB family transcription factor [Chloroflexota bacterium]
MAHRLRAGAETCQERCIHVEDVARARSYLREDDTYIELAELFGALADATRATIVHILQHQELCTCDIAAVVGVTESGVSQHLRVLRSLRLVKSRRAGKFVYYSLDDAHISLLVQIGLVHLGHEEEAGIAEIAAAATRTGGR